MKYFIIAVMFAILAAFSEALADLFTGYGHFTVVVCFLAVYGVLIKMVYEILTAAIPKELER
ncbi:hypothetical protein HQ865_01330 [Mucilaginibacter mali]|uniref:Gliding motility protein GldL n=1 Tax=Mucilaginibacter mali TaxID=2740462 RepID=A0A7D4TVC4_9SPHI|nr:hypothetical protein [Mucilaginibacter mali]QKJ28457.1 hypothetical protein HQ865_01330 [Mucilaginibacter mali]